MQCILGKIIALYPCVLIIRELLVTCISVTCSGKLGNKLHGQVSHFAYLAGNSIVMLSAG